jgi:GT2 family glycosyltransferase
VDAFRSGSASIGRRVYRALPLPERLKAPIKDAIYISMGLLFRGTPSYAAWRESRFGPVSLPAAEQVEIAASNQTLKTADGRWEWDQREPVKRDIARVLAERARRAQPIARQLISIEPDRLAAAARGIDLPDPGEKPDVSIIVPVYGHLKYTIECLLSIAAAGGGLTFEVIVADDASGDETRAALADVPHLRVSARASNVGFLRNCNLAAADARGRFIVFLNNDTQVRPGWLEAMTRIYGEEENVGAVGPKLVYPSGLLQDAGVRVRRVGAVEMIGLNGLPEDRRWSYRRDVDYVSGACLMIETALFRELGGFDDSLAPAYCEDLELGLRLNARGLRSIYTPDAEVVHHLSVTSDATDADFKMRAITRNMQVIAERYQAQLDELDDVRFVAFYLPQFHPFEQNDLWWGTGFTEWTNVAQARPNWVGHYQPRVPTDLGYYDLRVPQVLESQWRLASRYGVDAFCYYYYWFAGSRLLERPLERLLDPTQPANPFCLCWANENWTRRWDGQDSDVLIAQKHSARDDIAVIRDICRYVDNPAYIRVRGRPLLLVYRVDLFPDFARTAERWRAECRRIGVGEIELAMVESFRFAENRVNPATYGCDAIVEFPAHYIPDTKEPAGALLNPSFSGGVADYAETAVRKVTRPHPGYKQYRGVIPGWDNTPRRQSNPFVLENSTPGAFQGWLETVIAETKRDLQGDDRLIFVNAWNEWAEGAYLEPDRRFGHAYLEAIRNARDASRFPADAGAR